MNEHLIESLTDSELANYKRAKSPFYNEHYRHDFNVADFAFPSEDTSALIERLRATGYTVEIRSRAEAVEALRAQGNNETTKKAGSDEA
ncbi:MAG: hypothetical protein EKK55_22625 [Rhodocyclaceae bacterium]|nr:MAG: hypothetical protein EKK55_22625 [Rhodocyclaceae bacterium]